MIRPVRWWRDDATRYQVGRGDHGPWSPMLLEPDFAKRWAFVLAPITVAPMLFEALAPMPTMPLFEAPAVMPGHDPGDEDRGPLAMRFVMGRHGGVVCRYPGRPLYAPTQPDHDPGDEQRVVVGIESLMMAYTDGI